MTMNLQQLDFLKPALPNNILPSIGEAIKALRAGQPILLLDANDRENEGDLVVAAEKISPQSMNFLIKKGSGVVCLAMPKAKLDELALPMMHHDNTNTFQTAFTVSIEASSGVSTGVSAQDRAHTIQVAMADQAKASDLARPGHVFPLAAKMRGVFERMGHTEGSVDLMTIADLKPGAVLCELMNEDGSMTTGEDRLKFAREQRMPVVSVEDILFHRIRFDNIISEHKTKSLTTRFGQLRWHQISLLDNIKINLFKSQNILDTNQACRVHILEASNLSNRFLAQILAPSDDDPMHVALDLMGKGQLDLVAMIDPMGANITDNKILALLCRSILELKDINLLAKNLNNKFDYIAANYFGFNLLS